MPLVIKRPISMQVLAVLAVVIAIAGIVALTPSSASAQELIGNPGVTLYRIPISTMTLANQEEGVFRSLRAFHVWRAIPSTT